MDQIPQSKTELFKQVLKILHCVCGRLKTDLPKIYLHPNLWNLWILPDIANEWTLNVVKNLERGNLSWIIWEPSTCDHMYPYKTGAEGVFTQTHIVDVITKGEIGMICPQAKLKGERNRFFSWLFRGSAAWPTPWFQSSLLHNCKIINCFLFF